MSVLSGCQVRGARVRTGGTVRAEWMSSQRCTCQDRWNSPCWVDVKSEVHVSGPVEQTWCPCWVDVKSEVHVSGPVEQTSSLTVTCSWCVLNTWQVNGVCLAADVLATWLLCCIQLCYIMRMSFSSHWKPSSASRQTTSDQCRNTQLWKQLLRQNIANVYGNGICLVIFVFNVVNVYNLMYFFCKKIC